MPGEKHLLVIAIDKYLKIPSLNLNNTKTDAARIVKVLDEKYGFILTTPPIVDEHATREYILDTLADVAGRMMEEDDLIIFYAGHGMENPDTGIGYLVPSDYNGKQSQLINNSAIVEIISGMRSKHILLISDSCFSGNFIERIRTIPFNKSHDELERLNSRWVFAAGGAETVKDGQQGEGSPFSKSLCQVLEENEKISLSCGELFDTVTELTQDIANQKPNANPIRCSRNQGGQMIFRLRPPISAETVQKAEDPITLDAPQFIPVIPNTVEHYISRTVTAYEHQRDEVSYFFQPEKGRAYLKDLVYSQNRIVLLGTAGSGKSIELAKLAQAFKQNNFNNFVPVYKKFNLYTDQTIESYLPEGWQIIEPGKAVILLDGLDEVQGRYMPVALRKIGAFSEKFKDLRIIISCRSNFYELPSSNFTGTLEGFKVQLLNDISLLEVRDYADHRGVSGEQFVSDANKYGFMDLIQKPYFLEILIAYYEKTGTLDISRLEIMGETLTRLYTDNKQHHISTATLPDRSEIFAILGKAAFVMAVTGKNFLTDEEIHKVFPSHTQFEILHYLPGIKRYSDKEMWMFEHNNLQEFLAARVLLHKSFEELRGLVTIDIGLSSQIRPNWVNTLSFLISMAETKEVDALLSWIVENDTETVIRFEPDRLGEAQRTKIFKDIFNSYEKKQIWLSSNKFSDEDLGRFGQNVEVLDFLISKIKDDSLPIISKLSAIMIVRNFDTSFFPDHKEELRKTFMWMLHETDLSPQAVQMVIGALVDLKITDRDTVSAIVSQYRNNINQYVRAGMYKLLQQSNLQDENLDVFLDGLDLNGIAKPEGKRDEVNLIDEDTHLRLGLSKIKGSAQLSNLLDSMATDSKQYLFAHPYKELFEKILENCIEAYTPENSIYNGVYTLFRKAGFIYHKSFSENFYNFFEKTGNLMRAFHATWVENETSDYLLGESLEILIKPPLLEQILKAYSMEEYDIDDMKKLHDLIDWNQAAYPDAEQLLSNIEKAALSNNQTIFARRPWFDWKTKNQKNYQDSFDLLFDSVKLIQAIDMAYEILGKTELSKSDLSYGFTSFDDKRLEITNVVRDLIREFAFQDNSVKADEIKNWVQTDSRFVQFQIQEIYRYLTSDSGNNLKIDEHQFNFIQQWSSQPDSNKRIVWTFLNRLELTLPKQEILNLTLYFDSNGQVDLRKPGTIDLLEKFIERNKLKERVLINLQNGIANPLILCSNAAYAIKQNIIPAFPLIIDQIEKYEGYEYKLEQLLALWFERQKNASRLVEFIQKVSEDTLRWKAISLLQACGEEISFLQAYLKLIMYDESQEMDRRFMAVGYLYLLNDLEAFKFTVAHILEKPDPSFDFHNKLHNLPTMKHSEMMPDLLKLYVIARKEEFQKNDFNNFESIIVNTIYNIGAQSEKNLKEVELILLEFMRTQGEEGKNFNSLYYLFARMEEQLFASKPNQYSVEDALKEWA